MQVIAAKQLAADVDASGRGHVLINSLNPNLCDTTLFRHAPLIVRAILAFFVFILGRTAEQGARCHMAAAFAGEESQGRYMLDCEVAEFPKSMRGPEGEKRSEKVWGQLLALLDGIEPGISKSI